MMAGGGWLRGPPFALHPLFAAHLCDDFQQGKSTDTCPRKLLLGAATCLTGHPGPFSPGFVLSAFSDKDHQGGFSHFGRFNPDILFLKVLETSVCQRLQSAVPPFLNPRLAPPLTPRALFLPIDHSCPRFSSAPWGPC